jgi:hypothetical protein
VLALDLELDFFNFTNRLQHLQRPSLKPEKALVEEPHRLSDGALNTTVQVLSSRDIFQPTLRTVISFSWYICRLDE